MPLGLIIFEWNERSGIEILFEYPEKISSKFSQKTLIQVFNMHEFEKREGTSTLTTNIVNYVSYFSGPETGYYFVLFLTMLENPEDYEPQVKEASKAILEHIEDEEFLKEIPEIFDNLANSNK